MTPEETLNKFVRDIVNAIIGTNGFAIKANQDAPRPSGEYADVQLITDSGIGWEQSVYSDNISDDDMTQTIEGQRELMYSVGFYRGQSNDNCRSVRTGLLRNSIQELFGLADIGFVRASECRNIPEAYENGWESRSQFDIFLNVVGSDTDIVRSILSVDVSGQVQSNSNINNLSIIIP